jgi:hypothetical protein
MNARCICACTIARFVASGPISAEEGSFRYVETHGSRSIAVVCTVTRTADSVTVATASEAFTDKMLVRRAGTERIEVNGVTSLAERIHFSPAGALAPFWGADFWYRVSDGAWIYSKLPEDGGNTVTAIAP